MYRYAMDGTVWVLFLPIHLSFVLDLADFETRLDQLREILDHLCHPVTLLYPPQRIRVYMSLLQLWVR